MSSTDISLPVPVKKNIKTCMVFNMWMHSYIRNKIHQIQELISTYALNLTGVQLNRVGKLTR